MDVTIGARQRGDQGKGLRAITCSAFLLALLNRCLSKARPHLGLLVLDSPLLARPTLFFYKESSFRPVREAVTHWKPSR
jgi:hypothetical protein